MSVQELVYRTATDFVKIIDGQREILFHADRMADLMNEFGSRKVYILHPLKSNVLEIIVRKEG